MMKALVVCLLVCAASTCGWAGGVMTYYVAPRGLDSNDGSVDHPFATIQKAADLVNPGDTVIVRDGVYTDFREVFDKYYAAVYITRSGTEAQPIVFRSEHRWGAVVNGLSNTVHYAFWCRNCSYVQVEGFEVTEFHDGGLGATNAAHHITYKGNHVHHMGNIYYDSPGGMGGGGGDNPDCHHNVYDGNVFHDLGRIGPSKYQNLDHGLYMCGDNMVITNNVFYNCKSGRGLQLAGYDTVDGAIIANNVFAWGGEYDQLVLWAGSGGRGTTGLKNITVENNIFYCPPAGVPAIKIYNWGDFHNITIRNNLLYGCTYPGGLYQVYQVAEGPAEVHAYDNIEGYPYFVNATATPYDFHLGDDSPAIDRGIADGAPKTDMDGRPRPQGKGYDIGAYER